MTPKRRCKVLLDEMMPRGNKFPHTNHYHDVKHLVHDFKESGLLDQQVIQLANKEDRIVVTKNIKHFLPLAKQFEVDIVGITESIFPETLDKILLSKLDHWPSKEMKGRFVSISKPKRK